MIELDKSFPRIEGLRHLDLFPETKDVPAAVVMLFVQVKEEYHLIFTKRSENLRTHKGQISFPGGHRDEGEMTPTDTALRECFEEVGLESYNIKILGALDKVISHVGKEVYPVVGIYLGSMDDIVMSEAEISEVFTVPWEIFAAGMEKKHPITFKGHKYLTKSYEYKKWFIWGLTAQIIYNASLKKKRQTR